jgi:hypothetical protein
MIENRTPELRRGDTTTTVEKPLSTADIAGRVDAREVEDGQVEAARNAPASQERAPLFPDTELGGFRHRWQNVQAGFVDDPRTAVRQADELVASVMKRLADVFAEERSRLEHDWDKGGDVSTEDLRQALQRYRSFLIAYCPSDIRWRTREPLLLDRLPDNRFIPRLGRSLRSAAILDAPTSLDLPSTTPCRPPRRCR